MKTPLPKKIDRESYAVYSPNATKINEVIDYLAELTEVVKTGGYTTILTSGYPGMKTTAHSIINKAVDRFLGWELPDFHPDGGITFKRLPNHTAIGTNLFSAEEAKAMFEYCLEDSKVVNPTPLIEELKAAIAYIETTEPAPNLDRYIDLVKNGNKDEMYDYGVRLAREMCLARLNVFLALAETK